jgi:hypothetical protein
MYPAASHSQLGKRLQMQRRFVVLLLVLSMMAVARAYGAVDLPLHHWAYEDIERLAAMGVIDRAMLGSKPYSRKEAAKYVARAIERAGGDRLAESLLGRLTREFRTELAGPKPGALRYGARVQTEFDFSSIGAGQEVRLRENRGGEYYVDGVQNQTDVRAWLEVNDWAALTFQPKFISDPHVLGFGATENNEYFYVREFNVKLSKFNIALEVGRSSLWWGHGYHGSLLLTDHAFPLDMIKLGSDEAFRLPWVLSELGEWKVQTFLGQLERERDFPRAKLFGLRVSYLPAGWLELGLTRLTQFNGEGREHQSFPQAVFDAYTSEPNAEELDVNEQAMLDFRATIPGDYLPFPAGMQVYGELGSEDKWSKTIPSRGAYLVGIYIPQLFRGDSTDLRIQYADTDYTRRNTQIAQVWYNNATYSSGMRHRGFSLGHHMGTDATDLLVRATRYLSDKLQLGVSVDIQERDRGQPVHETKREAALDLTWWLSAAAQLTVGYAYQRLKSPGQISDVNPFVETFAADVSADNHLLWTRLAVEF